MIKHVLEMFSFISILKFINYRKTLDFLLLIHPVLRCNQSNALENTVFKWEGLIALQSQQVSTKHGLFV